MTETFDRRALLALATAAGAGAAVPATGQTMSAEGANHMRDMMVIPRDAPKIAILVHPGMIALDLINPMTVFSILRFRIGLVWKNKAPVATDVGIPITPTQAFEECPRDLDALFVPGGLMGSIACMNDPAVIAFLADRGARATWVTSICTGALTLGGAGLLNGYGATGHWGVTDLLPLLGARHVDERVVIDRNRMTGAGATAGIDFALTLAAELRGEEEARRAQLILEYSPAPPYRNGTPAEAGPERAQAALSRRTWMDTQARAGAEQAAARLRITT